MTDSFEAIERYVMPQKILLVEDDAPLAQQVVTQLTSAGFDVQWWPDVAPFPESSELPWALVILDIMLPGGSGLNLLSSLRERSDAPVLVLSARNDTTDKVQALKLGADDYMTKPFWPDELVERVKARLRRPALRSEDAFVVGDVSIDTQSRTVSVKGESVDVTRVEFDLLVALARRPGAAVTRQWLVEHVLDPQREGGERTLDVHISRLRRKLGEHSPIETVWGIGYRLHHES